MFKPNFHFSNSIVNSLVKFEVNRNYLLDREIKELSNNELEKRAKSHSLMYLGHILDINLTLKDAEKVAAGKKIDTNDHRGILLNNYRNVYEFIRSHATDAYVDIDISVMLHINKLLLNDWKQPWESKFRIAGESIDATSDNWCSLRDTSISSENIQDELNDLIDWYRANTSTINPMVRVAIVIYRLIRISPYVFMNKTSIIALMDYLLYKNGYLNHTYMPITRIFDVYGDEFIDSWDVAAKSNGKAGGEDMTLWIEQFIHSLTGDIQDTKDSLQAMDKDANRSIKQPFLNLNKRQLKILKYLQTIPTVQRDDYVQMMNVSSMTAYRDIVDLVSKKLLKIAGSGRGTKYMLVSR